MIGREGGQAFKATSLLEVVVSRSVLCLPLPSSLSPFPFLPPQTRAHPVPFFLQPSPFKGRSKVLRFWLWLLTPLNSGALSVCLSTCSPVRLSLRWPSVGKRGEGDLFKQETSWHRVLWPSGIGSSLLSLPCHPHPCPAPPPFQHFSLCLERMASSFTIPWAPSFLPASCPLF